MMFDCFSNNLDSRFADRFAMPRQGITDGLCTATRKKDRVFLGDTKIMPLDVARTAKRNASFQCVFASRLEPMNVQVAPQRSEAPSGGAVAIDTTVSVSRTNASLDAKSVHSSPSGRLNFLTSFSSAESSRRRISSKTKWHCLPIM